MLAWLDQALICLEQQTDIILITVADVRGSAPRNTTTRMLVGEQNQWLTIGGGNLEWQATAKAKEYLRFAREQTDQTCNKPNFLNQQDDNIDYTKSNIWFDLFQLGPSLGQCCGGVVGVVFEHITAADLPWLLFLQKNNNQGIPVKKELRFLPKQAYDNVNNITQSSVDKQISLIAITENELNIKKDVIYKGLTAAQKASGISELSQFKPESNGGFVYTEFIQTEHLDIYVFGAGHVGKALVNLLGTLPCNVIWVDSRAEQFPQTVATNVTIEETDIPESVIESAAPGSCYVIMTHDHALDQRLCEQLLKRDDALYFGLIGSRTKRHKFEHRFKAKGIDQSRYEKMVCPIGISAIKGKEPAIIALAVAAQLMCLREGHFYARESVAKFATK